MQRTIIYEAAPDPARLAPVGEMIEGTARELRMLAKTARPAGVFSEYASTRLIKKLNSGEICLLKTRATSLYDPALQEAFGRSLRSVRYLNTTQLVLIFNYRQGRASKQ